MFYFLLFGDQTVQIVVELSQLSLCLLYVLVVHRVWIRRHQVVLHGSVQFDEFFQGLCLGLDLVGVRCNLLFVLGFLLIDLNLRSVDLIDHLGFKLVFQRLKQFDFFRRNLCFQFHQQLELLLNWIANRSYLLDVLFRFVQTNQLFLQLVDVVALTLHHFQYFFETRLMVVQLLDH